MPEPHSPRVPASPTLPDDPTSLKSSPPIPPRSPLRPPPRSLSHSPSLDPLPPDDLVDFTMRDRDSYPSLHTLVNSVTSISLTDDSTITTSNLLSKALPLRPDSPLSLSLDDPDDPDLIPQQAPMTKRQHALLELLSSERAYASDLALIRTVHIPLALGQTVPLHQTPPSPPNSSASSSRTLSTSSDSSIAALGPPMTQEDVKLIFNNIADLALFSDGLCEELEDSLGALLDGGVGDDRVGALFLRIIPDLEKPYKQYITRHPNAVAHLQSLPNTPALQAYLTHTQSIASTHSHAWDLSSLLIKPVQRLLKYPLLLSAIIDETPDIHPDKDNLKEARRNLEEVARNVNEGRRRAEVIKDVLSGGKKIKIKPAAGVGVSASVNLTKMKSLRHGGPKAALLSGESEEAALVERMQRELKDIDEFTQKFARNVVDWAKMTSNVVLALRAWAVSFGKVIGLSPDQESEAFNAFLALVERQLMPLCVQLEASINERLLKEIAHLLTTMNQPLKLLASMNEQEPYHYHLMTMNVSNKTRPPPSLLAASTNYLALRGQLAAELPQYICLLHRGLAIFVRRLAEIQTEFWRDVRNSWAELWEMLRVEGEWNAGHEETVNVWCARWMDVADVMEELNIVQQKKLYQEPVRYSMDSTSSAGKKKSSTAVSSVLSSLEPVHVAVSGPYPLTPSIKSRGRGNSDASIGGGQARRSVGRKGSNDSLRSGKSSRKAKSPRREYPPPEHLIPDVPMLPRTQSMTLAAEKPARPPNSRSTTAYTEDSYGPRSPNSRSTTTYVDDSYSPRPPNSRSTTGYTEDGYGPRPSTSRSTTGYAEDGHSEFGYGYGYRQPESAPVHMQYFEPERERDRGRLSPTNYKRKSAEQPPRRPSHSHHRAGNTSSFPQGSHHQYDPDPAPMPNRRDSWATRPSKYVCQVIHHCNPPPSVSYFSFPFFKLKEGEFFEVLQEAGHPSIHPKLPLYVDEGEDCLLLCRDMDGKVGWALASFLEPVNLPL